MDPQASNEAWFNYSETGGGIVTITLERAERRNALHPAAHYALDALWDELAARTDIRCIILTGAGSAFCAGYDIKDSLQSGVMDVPASGFGGLTYRTDFPHPIIAAVNGAAFGGGFEMVLACDLVVASTMASFALPEARIGWAAVGGGIQRLPRSIGLTQALGIILTGRRVTAHEGRDLGFINEVVAPDELLEAAQRWAKQILECGPLAVHVSRKIARDSVDRPLAEMLDIANLPAATRLLDSPESREGRLAFLERRSPRWPAA